MNNQPTLYREVTDLERENGLPRNALPLLTSVNPADEPLWVVVSEPTDRICTYHKSYVERGDACDFYTMMTDRGFDNALNPCVVVDVVRVGAA